MISFAGVAQRNYIGQIAGMPVTICKPQTDPRIAPINIDWFTYVQNGIFTVTSDMGININGEAGGVVVPIDRIASVYIDNTGVPVPIYVVFPDTGFVAVAKPYDAVFIPVVTNGLKCIVYARGFLDSMFATTQLISRPVTRVVLCNTTVAPLDNVELPSVYPQWRASPTITRGPNIYTPGFGSPALGDQIRNYRIYSDPSGGGAGPSSQPIFNIGASKPTEGFFYLTAYDMNAIFVGTTGNRGAAIVSGSVSGELLHYDWIVGASLYTQNITRMTGLQIKLDATEDWTFFLTSIDGSAAAQSILTLTICWTYNPQ